MYTRIFDIINFKTRQRKIFVAFGQMLLNFQTANAQYSYLNF